MREKSVGQGASGQTGQGEPHFTVAVLANRRALVCWLAALVVPAMQLAGCAASSERADAFEKAALELAKRIQRSQQSPPSERHSWHRLDDNDLGFTIAFPVEPMDMFDALGVERGDALDHYYALPMPQGVYALIAMHHQPDDPPMEQRLNVLVGLALMQLEPVGCEFDGADPVSHPVAAAGFKPTKLEQGCELEAYMYHHNDTDYVIYAMYRGDSMERTDWQSSAKRFHGSFEIRPTPERLRGDEHAVERAAMESRNQKIRALWETYKQKRRRTAQVKNH